MTRTKLSREAETDPVWAPEPGARGRMVDFMDWVRSRGTYVDDYDDLWTWSTTHVEEFWGAVWEYFDLRSSSPHDRVLERRDMPARGWFAGARMNYAEQMLRYEGAGPAVIETNERGTSRSIEWPELRAQVAAAAAGLAALGVEKGDRVGAVLPNTIDAVVAHLATISLGAVWANVAPETGINGVLDRLTQISPAVLICVESYGFGGRDHDRMPLIEELQEELPGLKATIVVPGPLDQETSAQSWPVLLADHAGATLAFEQVGFEHPVWILFTSGTTGLPKPIMHSHGGMLLDYLVKLGLHLELGPEDRILWYTSSGWAVWNFLVGCLGLGTTIVLYDGSPKYPDAEVLWDAAAREQVTAFGTSPAFLAAAMKRGIDPTRGRDLSSLDKILATGAPVTREIYEWVYGTFPDSVWMSVTYGTTDTGSSLAAPSACDPVFPGEVQKRALGVALHAVDASGTPVIDRVGEIVLTAPMPSMPVGFWGDEDGSRYRETYFSTFDGYWWQGDAGIVTTRGGVVIQGRSDATINRGGVRMGASEIYRAVLAEPEPVDMIAVDVPVPGTADSVLALFVVLREGMELNADLENRLRSSIRERCSPRHVPDRMIQVGVLPHTLTGKAIEVPIKRILMGHDPATAVSRASVDSPEALDYFAELARTWPTVS